MKKLAILVLLFNPVFCWSQIINQKATDYKKNNEMLIGYCNRDGFGTVNCNFDSVYQAEYAAYKPDPYTMKQLALKMNHVRITLVMASWCGDSKDWVPRFYKIMDELSFNYNKLTLICVDRDKKAPGTHVESLKIERVPTFIFYRKKTELGRIIEVPSELLEKDILKILANQR